jgi:hypothetical protein
MNVSWQSAVQVCSNYGSWELDGATIGKTIFICVDIGNNL